MSTEDIIKNYGLIKQKPREIKMKYIEQLKSAKKNNINPTKLFVANEVDILLKDYSKKIDGKIFEEICLIVYENYLKIDYSSINDVAKIVCELFIHEQKIEEKIIREKLENMYL